MSTRPLCLIHIFIDHSNIWGGARLASRFHDPHLPEETARISIKNLDRLLGGDKTGVSTRIVCGGVPPGMEGVWGQYHACGYDTHRLFKDENWKEHGVDHAIIGHMWRLLALHTENPTVLVLASGDGKANEFRTSYHEVLQQVIFDQRYASWEVRLASFHWSSPSMASYRSPTSGKMLKLVTNRARAKFINLDDHYGKVVYHEKKPAG